MTFNAQDFVDTITSDLVMNAPSEIQEMVLTDERLQAEVLALQQDILEGLNAIQAKTGTIEALAQALKSRKSRAVALASAHSYTVEKLVRLLSDRVLAQAAALVKESARS